jgi:hypothetical protein
MVITANLGPSLTCDQTRDGPLAFRMKLVRMKKNNLFFGMFVPSTNVAGSICREVHASTCAFALYVARSARLSEHGIRSARAHNHSAFIEHHRLIVSRSACIPAYDCYVVSFYDL